ncbi:MULTISPECIES: DUF6638 family protein [unclassified Ruegeria]|uniref:DUF6638 family protein n=1 Tax=unclassified Ruegeria TaxID=2625375 RepID=UPI001489E8D8|nr:DUF6638 family protein [Ruegeria sp. HKCCA6837]NOD49330.1 hypothetical protein [Ruegeria sp. HKCCD5849]NOD53371.1 hypothetical protein [Ruegeria sp. HKCCD5851]NOD69695.1 hypothetical protein [Ruegeria sp. HKCCD7303]NOE35570.1 hypothetical protein [Ruegeria sp. HKCCD7318]
MIRLIEKGLMFGNLVHISSPALVERYNRALQHLAGKTTALTDFHVDISGYSPEVGIELEDTLYLNPNGVNRQFILLTTEQKRAPLLNVKFSTSRDILREFIEMNEAQLFALTATDAVAGELVNSVFKLSTPRDLLNLRKIEIEADTAGGTLRKAQQLAGMVERFKTEEDAWFDDVLIAKMIETAKETGDVTRNPVRLRHTDFEQRNFWTAHFGGLYLFPDVDHPAAICMGEKPDDLPIKYTFDPSQRNQIAKFLDYNDLVEPIVKARGVDAAAILQQKMDFLTVDAAADADVDLTGLDRSDMRRLARNHSDRLPEAYHGLAQLLRWASDGGPWPRITSDHPAYFYTLRAADTPNRDLVNMLLSELAPLDPRQMFICHKELFYRTYSGWPESKKAYVADFLAREYQVDKQGARAALFGHEPDMSGNDRVSDDIIARVGPWGSVRKG